MDYKKTNAPTNTVTRDMVALSSDTGNIYETVCIIAKRANQIAVEMKTDLATTIWRRFLKIGNKLRSLVIMRNCRNRFSLLRKNI